jgi:hypothetical protein
MPFTKPTNIVPLPSKGLVYPKNNLLSSGTIEMMLGGAQQEDILANDSFKEEGTTMTRLIKSLIVSDINYDDIIVGDKNAIFMAARILMFGKLFDINYLLPGESKPRAIQVDLTTLKDKAFNEAAFNSGINEFDFVLPLTKNKITYKLLTHKDEMAIEQEIAAMRKNYNDENVKEASINWYHKIVAVNGVREIGEIRSFVNEGLITIDSIELSKDMYKNSPGIELKFDYTKENGEVLEGLPLPITANFFRSPFLL